MQHDPSDTTNSSVFLSSTVNLEAEQIILGNLLQNNDCLISMETPITLTTDDFYSLQHQFIYETIQQLLKNGEQANVLTIADQLAKTGNLEKTGGLTYLTDLANHFLPVSDLDTYVSIVRDCSLRRQLGELNADFQQTLKNPKGLTAAEILSYIETKIYSLTQFQDARRSLRSTNEMLMNTLEHIEIMSKKGSSLLGLSCGFEAIDNVTAGFQGGQLIIIAARPAMGKTSLAINMAEHTDEPVLFFTFEMSYEDIMMRMLSSLSNIPLYKIKKGDLTSDEWLHLTKNSRYLKEKDNIFIDDAQNATPQYIASQARILSRKLNKKLGLIIIDYLQLMNDGAQRRNDNRTNEVSNISRALKKLARELNTPIITISQLNRAVETRQQGNKRPTLGDLRDSGSIEQDADVVMLIYRDDYYNKESEEKGVATIIVAKNRNGETKDDIKLGWLGQYTSFRNELPRSYLQSLGNNVHFDD